MKPGDVIAVKAHKANGVCYQHWQATVTVLDDRHIVTDMHKGTRVDDVRKGTVYTAHRDRATYWFDKPYSFIETFDDGGRVIELYMDICSLPRIVGEALHYTDYELDVTRMLPGAAEIIDEDEFAEAAVTYGYPEAFQAECYRAAHEALAVANAYRSDG